MSCGAPAVATSGPRKRTSSFSTPKPYKAPKMTSLRRTASYLTLPEMQGGAQAETKSSSSSSSADCSALVLRHYKEQRQRRRKVQITHAAAQFTIGPAPPSSLPPLPKRTAASLHFPRASSPLAPTQKLLPPRASFPRSKQAPDLYKIAITTRMRCSPEGQKILSMGPRLAVSILTATRELERIVASQIMDSDNDYPMLDATLSRSWIVVPGGEDWEMIDCSG